jgi:hypothetical protein
MGNKKKCRRVCFVSNKYAASSSQKKSNFSDFLVEQNQRKCQKYIILI